MLILNYEQWKDTFLIELEKWCQSGFSIDYAYEYIKKYNLKKEDACKRLEKAYDDWIASCETEEIQLHRIIAWGATYYEVRCKTFQEEPADFISRNILQELNVVNCSENVFDGDEKSIRKILSEQEGYLELFQYDIISKEEMINDFKEYSRQTQHSLECWIEQYGEIVKEQIPNSKKSQEKMFQIVKSLEGIKLDSRIIRINKLGEEIDNRMMEEAFYVFFSEGQLRIIHMFDYY